MSEYRHDLITNRWIILATERGRRPNDFVKAPNANSEAGEEFDPHCPFCPGNETMTPPEVHAVRPEDTAADTPGWQVRTITNKYPALFPHAQVEAPDEALICQAGVGIHEVIIESPSHCRHFARHEAGQGQLVLRVLRERYRFHSAQDFQQVAIFYNHGVISGASLAHPHFQLIALDRVPGRLEAQLDYCRDYKQQNGVSVFDMVLESELDAGARLIGSNDHFIAFCPYASICPFEVYILPRAEQAQFGQISDEALGDLAHILQQLLGRLDGGLGDPSLNIAFHTAPAAYHAQEGFRWYLQIYPRLSTVGGFELTTDIYINTMSPETAAAFYRGEM